MAFASLWLAVGIFIDAYYHFHNDVETFFEPAHGVLYAGLAASVAFTVCALAYYRWRGYAWRYALPAGYDTTLWGLAVFLAGGATDMVKHQLYGFEEGFNALLSPTHLLIGAGMFLVIAGPIRSGLASFQSLRSLLGQLPVMIAAASMLELMHWGTQFIFLGEAESSMAPLAPSASPHDVLTLLTLAYYKQGLGLLAVIVQSLLITGFALFLKRRLQLAPGFLTGFMLLGNAFVAAAHSVALGQFEAVIAASAACGICGDLFRLGPLRAESRAQTLGWYAFAFLVPAIYWAVFLAVLANTMHGIWWSHDVTIGSILYAGLFGVFLNALCFGPARARLE
jgi:hypothetical protein